MSDLENELLGLAEDEPRRKRGKVKSSAYVDSSEDEAGEGEEEIDVDMDMDIESEEGEGEDIPVRARPAPVKRSSSTKVKKATGGKGRAVKSKAKAKAVKVEEPKASVKNPYPLEGKYIDEDDRDQLDDMPEIEREAILAQRQEEMQKYKDAQQLEAMYQMAGMGSSTTKKAVFDEAGDDEEEDMDMDMDIEEEEDADAQEEEPSRKRRKHTSVTKETTRVLNQLQKVRKRRHEDAERRAEKRALAGPGGLDQSDDEDGEIDDFRDRDRDGDYNYRGSPERERERDRKRRDSSASEKDENAELDRQPTSVMDVNAARIGRYELVECMYKAGFINAMHGAFVRLMTAEREPDGRPKYRIQRIEDMKRITERNRYPIEYKDRTIYEDFALLCSYGRAKREFRVADISNGEFTNNEFGRFRQIYEADRMTVPKPSELKGVADTLKEIRDRGMTNDEINAQVAARRQGPHRTSSSTSHDAPAALGRSPSDSSLPNSSSSSQAQLLATMSEHDRKVAAINEVKRKRVKEKMRNAHEESMARRRAEEVMIKAKEAAAAAAANAVQSEADDIQAIGNGKNGNAAAGGQGESQSKGIKKGETAQQYVARTMELDLGDF